MLFFYTISLLALVDVTRGSDCEANCTDKPVFSPSRLVVRFNESASANCTVCERDCINQTMGLEFSEGAKDQIGPTLLSWTVPRLTEWAFSLQCYYEHIDDQCCVKLPMTVYHPPDAVSLVLTQYYMEPLLEDRQYTLRCIVRGVAPVKDVSVTFYRGREVLDTQRLSNDTNNKPDTKSYYFNITATREDDGEDFWCDAKMELGAEGPQPPLVVASAKVTASVFYKPQPEKPSNTITILEGETLHLNCSSIGNPAPSYSWTLPTKTRHPSNSSVLTIDPVAAKHAGNYTCDVSNSMGKRSVEFHVNVTVNNIIYIIVAVFLGLLLLVAVGVIIYMRYYSNNKTGNYNFMNVSWLKRKHTSVPTSA